MPPTAPAAPTAAAPAPTGRKRGTTGAVNQARLMAVEDALAAGLSHALIERTYSQPPPGGWGVTHRTIRNYIARVYADWRRRAASDPGSTQEERRERTRVFLLDQYTKADARKDHRGAAGIAFRLAQLDGLVVQRHEHSGPGGGPIRTEDPLAELHRRLARLVAAGTEGAGNGGPDPGTG